MEIISNPIKTIAQYERDIMKTLTENQIQEVLAERVNDGVPVRFVTGRQTWNVVTGESSGIGTNIIYQTVYWTFTKETARKIAKWTGTKAVFSEKEN